MRTSDLTSKPAVIVVTDLDGTLLDHHDYSFAAARPALDVLREYRIPLILNSSKTAAEILSLRENLQNDYPFIVENGGGIYLPEGDDFQVIAFGTRREDFLPIIDRLKAELGLSFRGFADMTLTELAECTEMDQVDCEKARRRDFTEPLLWQDNEANLQRFRTELSRYNLHVTRGGRFMHISGGADKGQSMQWLRRYYANTLNTEVTVVALGDSPNDIEMLKHADYAVIIRSPAHAPPQVQTEQLLISQQEGPAGWNECMHKCLEDLNILTETVD